MSSTIVSQNLVRSVPYFAELPEAALTALASCAVNRTFERGCMVFLEGDPCAGLWLVESGIVKVYQLSPQGREQILHTISPGGTFNDVAVLDGGPNPASVATLTEASLWVISRGDIQRLARQHPELAWALIESVARRTRHLVQMVEDLALRSVRARLARLLLVEAGRTAGAGELRREQMMTQSDMAARLGTVREMIGRALRDLADAGLIELDRHRIVISDRERLQAEADG